MHLVICPGNHSLLWHCGCQGRCGQMCGACGNESAADKGSPETKIAARCFDRRTQEARLRDPAWLHMPARWAIFLSEVFETKRGYLVGPPGFEPGTRHGSQRQRAVTDRFHDAISADLAATGNANRWRGCTLAARRQPASGPGLALRRVPGPHGSLQSQLRRAERVCRCGRDSQPDRLSTTASIMIRE